MKGIDVFFWGGLLSKGGFVGSTKGDKLTQPGNKMTCIRLCLLFW